MRMARWRANILKKKTEREREAFLGYEPDLYAGIDDVWFDIEAIWLAFLYLDPYRNSGMGASMIPLRAQLDYLEVFGVDDPQRFCSLIRAIDMEYLNAYHTDASFVPDRDKVDQKQLSENIKAVFQAFRKD